MGWLPVTHHALVMFELAGAGWQECREYCFCDRLSTSTYTYLYWQGMQDETLTSAVHAMMTFHTTSTQCLVHDSCHSPLAKELHVWQLGQELGFIKARLQYHHNVEEWEMLAPSLGYSYIEY